MDPDIDQVTLANAITGIVLLFFVITGTVLLIRGHRYCRKHKFPDRSMDDWLLQRPWSGVDVFSIVAFVWILQSVIHPFLPGEVSRPDQPLTTSMLLVGAGFQASVLLFIGLLLFRHGCGWKTAFGAIGPHRTTALRPAVMLYLAMWPVLITVTPLYHALLRGMGVAIDWQETLTMLTAPQSPSMLLILLVMALVLAPVGEELLFRGILLPVMRRKIGLWPAILLSSLLFAAFHRHLPSMAGLFIVSMACSLAAIYSGTVLSAIWLHAIFNTVSTLLAWTLTSS